MRIGSFHLLAVFLTLLSLAGLGTPAEANEKYAAIAAGVYTGVLPLREVLSLDFVMRPLLNGPQFWMDTLFYRVSWPNRVTILLLTSRRRLAEQ